MLSLIGVLNTLLPILYMVLLYLYGQNFYNSAHSAGRYLRNATLITIIVHFGEVALRGLYFGRFPMATISEFMSVLALSIAVVYLYVEHRLRLKTTGVFVLAWVFILQFFSSAFIVFDGEVPAILKSPMFFFHTSSAIISYSAFFISAIYGIMFVMLFNQIKSARFGIIYNRMPSLEELNEMIFRSALPGFIFLTISLVLGILWRKEVDPTAPHFDGKVISIYAVWFIYGAVIVGKNIGRWSGKWLAYTSIAGFVVILISFVIVNLFVTSFHRFG